MPAVLFRTRTPAPRIGRGITPRRRTGPDRQFLGLASVTARDILTDIANATKRASIMLTNISRLQRSMAALLVAAAWIVAVVPAARAQSSDILVFGAASLKNAL